MGIPEIQQLFWWAWAYRIANFSLGGPNIRSSLGGPILTIDRTIFEMWLGGL